MITDIAMKYFEEGRGTELPVIFTFNKYLSKSVGIIPNRMMKKKRAKQCGGER